MKKLKTILIATAVAAVVIPGFAATTTKEGSFTISLQGYKSSPPAYSLNTEKVEVTMEVKQEKFKEDTKALIANIGLAIGKTFSDKAKITDYDFDEETLTITDNDVKTLVTEGENVEIDNSEWASSEKGSSKTTYNSLPVPISDPTNTVVVVKSSGNWKNQAVANIYWYFQTSATTAVEYDLYVYAPGNGEEKFDAEKGTASDSSKVSGAKVVGTLTKYAGEGSVDYPLTGSLTASDKTTVK